LAGRRLAVHSLGGICARRRTAHYRAWGVRRLECVDGRTDRAAGLHGAGLSRRGERSVRGTRRFSLLLAPVRPAHDVEFPADLLHSSDGDAELLGGLALRAIEEALDGMPVDLEGGAPSREGASELAGLPSREETNLNGLRAPRGAVWSVGVHTENEMHSRLRGGKKGLAEDELRSADFRSTEL